MVRILRSAPRALPRPRMELIYHLLEEGVNVLHNDVDAIWGDNNIEVLQSADVVGQRDRHPGFLLRKWGATFCTGVLYIRSCPETKSIIRSMFGHEGHIHFFLDQLRFNRALDVETGGITWESKEEPPLTYKSTDKRTPDFGRMRKMNDLKVGAAFLVSSLGVLGGKVLASGASTSCVPSRWPSYHKIRTGGSARGTSGT
eukprot:scaffold452_cov235-Pinguiococcus_pyrenoidosus.AAC.12